MWMMPLHLHADKKSDYDDDIMDKYTKKQYTFLIKI